MLWNDSVTASRALRLLSLLLFTGAAELQPTRSIRIAYLTHTDAQRVTVDFLLEKFRGPNRTLLPGFDVAVDSFSFESLSGNASVRVVEALLAAKPYHAIIGPHAKADCVETVVLTAAARILHVVTGDNAEFTFQRQEKYPYVFRSLQSVVGILHCWMYILASNQWLSALSVWAEVETMDAANLFAAKYEIWNSAVLAGSNADGVSSGWLGEAWQNVAIERIRINRFRVVLTQIATSAGMYQFVCSVHRQRISGLQYFASGTYAPGWFNQEFDESLGLGDCSSSQVKNAIDGYITTLHVPAAPGITINIGSYYIARMPIVDGDDQSRSPLACFPGMTASDFYNSGELLYGAVAAGWIDVADVDAVESVRYFLGAAGTQADMLCTVLVALHDVLTNSGFDLSSIEQREEPAFRALVESVGQADFQGPAGRVRFYPNSGDREVIYYGMIQFGVVDDWLAVVTYPGPNGLQSPPLIRYLNENIQFTWADGSTGLAPRPYLAEFPACNESNAELVWDRCKPCSPGHFYDRELGACRRCPTGMFQNSSGQNTCNIAQPGWYMNNTETPTHATPCPAGHQCPQIGMITPQACPKGRYAAESGMEECQLCPQASYQNLTGASHCLPCEDVLHGSTTRFRAATQSTECLCPEGTFRPEDGMWCRECPEGMVCAEGSDMSNLPNMSNLRNDTGTYPEVQRGYMTLAAEPLTVYRCKSEEHCPGGPPASCAHLFDATVVACGSCVRQAYRSGEECKPCGSAGSLPMIITSVLLVVAVSVATLAINSDLRKTQLATLTILAMTSMLLTSLQAIGVFKQLAIPWVDPAKTLINLASFLTFDLEILQVSCSVGADPVRTYAFRQAVPLLAFLVVLTTLVVKHFTRFAWGADLGERRVAKVAVKAFNALGTLYSLFFISIVISALSPFFCYGHPGSSGWSVISYPSLLCFQSGQHTSMMVVSFIALMFVPLPFLAFCVYAILKYPQHVGGGGIESALFLHAFRFLFIRYHANRYYFASILLTRSLCVCLIPALLRYQPSTQVLFMSGVLITYSIVVTHMRPWRMRLCNQLDAAMNALMSVVLTCGGLFLEDTPDEDALAVMTTAALLLPLVLALCGIFLVVTRVLSSHPFYEYFICHHKAHAAAQARLVKILLQTKVPGCDVYIDSDDPKQMDALFDTIKSRVQHLIVYLTAETLRMPWCVGEIVTATWVQLSIYRLQTPSFIGISEEQLLRPESFLNLLGCNLSEYGIQWVHVTEALTNLLAGDAKLVEIDKDLLGTRRFDRAVCALLEAAGSAQEQLAQQQEEPGTAKVVISSDGGSDEANAAAGVLLRYVSGAVYKLYGECVCVWADHVEPSVPSVPQLLREAAAVVVLLSAGCLHSELCLRIICELQRQQSSVASGVAGAGPDGSTAHTATVVPVNTPDFIFPPLTYFTIETRNSSSMAKLFHDYGGASVAVDLILTFFKQTSVLLPTQSSQAVLDAQSQEVLRRMRIVKTTVHQNDVDDAVITNGPPLDDDAEHQTSSVGTVLSV